MNPLFHASLVVTCWSLEKLCELIHRMPFDNAFQEWCIRRFDKFCIFAMWSYDLDTKYNLKVWKYEKTINS